MAADYKTLLGLVGEFVEHMEGRPARTDNDLVRACKEAIAPSAPKNDPTILHAWPMVADDMCCSKTLAQAAKTGRLDGGDCFACPKCGTEFMPCKVGDMTSWEPVNDIEVFHLP